MVRILAPDGIDRAAADTLRTRSCEIVEQFFDPTPAALGEALKEYDALVVRSATTVREAVLDAAACGRLKLIIRAGVGTDNIDVDYARSKGIEVENTPNASSASVAELVIGHMFCLARHLHEANVTMRAGKWEKKKYTGIELAGKTLGLIGFGRIGKLTAQKASALGMNVIYTNKKGHKPENDPFLYVHMDDLLSRSDFISLHLPGESKPVISAPEIAKMKDGVFIINAGRGSLISEDALADALDCGKVAAAALDVFEQEPTRNERIFTHPKISLTPHIGASTVEAQERIGGEVAALISNFFSLIPHQTKDY